MDWKLPCVLLLFAGLGACGPQTQSGHATQFSGSPLLLLRDHSRPPAPASAQQTPFVQGRATVIAVDPTLGHVLLNLEGKPVDAYWETEYYSPRTGSIVKPGGTRPPVGVYHEPDVRLQAFDAKPGDSIAFIGMQTGNAIFLQGIEVLGK